MIAQRPRHLNPLFTHGLPFVALLLVLLTVGRSRMFRDPGSLWHTVVGERILERGELPTVDEFSFTFEGKPWIAQQWLAECVMALAHRLAGLDALLLLAAVVLAATYAGIGRRLRVAGLGWPGVILLLVIVMAASSHHFHARPHIATIALTMLSYAILCDVEAGRAPARRLWLLPPLIALWSNLHGGALAGIVNVGFVSTGLCFVLMGAFAPKDETPPPALRADMQARRPRYLAFRLGFDSVALRRCALLFFVTLLCVAAIWVNPYGKELPRVWFDLTGSKLLPEIISEHAPLHFGSVEGIAILALFALYVITFATSWRRMIRVSWLLPIPWFLMAIFRVRHAPLFAVFSTIAIAEMLPYSNLRQWLAGRGSALVAATTQNLAAAPTPSRRWAVMALPGATILLCVVLQVSGIRIPVIGAGWARLDETYWPIEATAALPDAMREAGDHRVFNQMLHGGYLIYAVPEARIYIDDRCELYGDAFLRRYLGTLHGVKQLKQELDAYELRLVLLSSKSPVAVALKDDPEWVCIHTDSVASLFVRR